MNSSSELIRAVQVRLGRVFQHPHLIKWPTKTIWALERPDGFCFLGWWFSNVWCQAMSSNRRYCAQANGNGMVRIRRMAVISRG